MSRLVSVSAGEPQARLPASLASARASAAATSSFVIVLPGSGGGDSDARGVVGHHVMPQRQLASAAVSRLAAELAWFDAEDG